MSPELQPMTVQYHSLVCKSHDQFTALPKAGDVIHILIKCNNILCLWTSSKLERNSQLFYEFLFQVCCRLVIKSLLLSDFKVDFF